MVDDPEPETVLFVVVMVEAGMLVVGLSGLETEQGMPVQAVVVGWLLLPGLMLALKCLSFEDLVVVLARS